MFLSRVWRPYSAAPCPRNTGMFEPNVGTDAKIDRRRRAFCTCDWLGAYCNGGGAVSGHPRQHGPIGPVLRSRWIGLDIARDAAGKLDVRSVASQ